MSGYSISHNAPVLDALTACGKGPRFLLKTADGSLIAIDKTLANVLLKQQNPSTDDLDTHFGDPGKVKGQSDSADKVKGHPKAADYYGLKMKNRILLELDKKVLKHERNIIKNISVQIVLSQGNIIAMVTSGEEVGPFLPSETESVFGKSLKHENPSVACKLFRFGSHDIEVRCPTPDIFGSVSKESDKRVRPSTVGNTDIQTVVFYDDYFPDIPEISPWSSMSSAPAQRNLMQRFKTLIAEEEKLSPRQQKVLRSIRNAMKTKFVPKRSLTNDELELTLSILSLSAKIISEGVRLGFRPDSIFHSFGNLSSESLMEMSSEDLVAKQHSFGKASRFTADRNAQVSCVEHLIGGMYTATNGLFGSD